MLTYLHSKNKERQFTPQENTIDIVKISCIIQLYTFIIQLILEKGSRGSIYKRVEA